MHLPYVFAALQLAVIVLLVLAIRQRKNAEQKLRQNLEQTICFFGETGIWGQAVRQRRPLIVNDFPGNHQLKKGYPKGRAPLHKYLKLPRPPQRDDPCPAGRPL